mmetsp:Transcript_24767/g.58953  ORF Transcript_24767/g.58953 Transcript_24767/m.58953 type:complete len:312 (-) Transcript_24767:543-1478(-)
MLTGLRRGWGLSGRSRGRWQAGGRRGAGRPELLGEGQDKAAEAGVDVAEDAPPHGGLGDPRDLVHDPVRVGGRARDHEGRVAVDGGLDGRGRQPEGSAVDGHPHEPDPKVGRRLDVRGVRGGRHHHLGVADALRLEHEVPRRLDGAQDALRPAARHEPADVGVAAAPPAEDGRRHGYDLRLHPPHGREYVGVEGVGRREDPVGLVDDPVVLREVAEVDSPGEAAAPGARAARALGGLELQPAVQALAAEPLGRDLGERRVVLRDAVLRDALPELCGDLLQLPPHEGAYHRQPLEELKGVRGDAKIVDLSEK